MKKKANIKELSSTGGTASAQPGSGEGMATKYAFDGAGGTNQKRKKGLLVTKNLQTKKKLYKEYKKSVENLKEIKNIKNKLNILNAKYSTNGSIKENKEGSFLYILESLEKENIQKIKNILTIINNKK